MWDINLSILVYDTEVFALTRQRQEPQELSEESWCQDSYFPAPTTTERGCGWLKQSPCSSCYRPDCNILIQTINQHFSDCDRSFRTQASLIRPAATSIIGSYEFTLLLHLKCMILTQEYGSTFAPPWQIPKPSQRWKYAYIYSSCGLYLQTKYLFSWVWQKRVLEKNVSKENKTNQSGNG